MSRFQLESLNEKMNSYIGIKYKVNGKSKEEGLDCYGLVKHFYNEEFNLKLKLFEANPKNPESIKKNDWFENRDGKFRQVPMSDLSQGDNYNRTGDIFTFLIKNIKNEKIIYDFHCGIFLKCLNNNHIILHTSEITGSVIELLRDYKNLKYKYMCLRYVSF